MRAPKDKTVDLHAFRERMVQSARTLSEMYEVLEGWSDLVVKENPILKCQDGCARCCKHQVLVGEQEWMLIHDWMRGNLTKAQRQRIIGRVRDQMVEAGNPLSRWLRMRNKSNRAFVRAVGRGFVREQTRCPMLGNDNRCEIYPVRPFVCRAYGRAEMGSGTKMFCEIFLGRLRQEPGAQHGMELQKLSVMAPKYFQLNDGPGLDDGQYTIMSAQLLRHSTSEGDLRKKPAPLRFEKDYPVVTQSDFPERPEGPAAVSTTTISVVDEL